VTTADETCTFNSANRVPVQSGISLPPWSSVTTSVKFRCASRLTMQPASDFY